MKKFILGLLIALPFIASATNYAITLNNTSDQKLYINNIQRLGCSTESEESQPQPAEESQPVYPITIAPKGSYKTYQYYSDSCKDRDIYFYVYYTKSLGETTIKLISSGRDSEGNEFKKARTQVLTELGDVSIYSATCRGDRVNGYTIKANCLAPSSILTTYKDKNVNVFIKAKMKNDTRKVHKLHNRHKG